MGLTAPYGQRNIPSSAGGLTAPYGEAGSAGGGGSLTAPYGEPGASGSGGSLSAPYSESVTAKLDGIDGRQFETRTVAGAKHIANSLTSSELADPSVGTDEIQDGVVSAAKLDRTYQLAMNTLAEDADVFRDITGTNPTTPVEVNDEDAASFPDGSTTGIRVSFEIPDYYDSLGNLNLYLRVSPSTSEANTFDVETDFRINGGALQGTASGSFSPSATLNDQTLIGPIRTISTGTVSPGDAIVFLIRRLGAADSHSGAMRCFRAVLLVDV